MNNFTSKLILSFCAVISLLACATSGFAGATIVIINNDGPNEGFNDAAPGRCRRKSGRKGRGGKRGRRGGGGEGGGGGLGGEGGRDREPTGISDAA